MKVSTTLQLSLSPQDSPRNSTLHGLVQTATGVPLVTLTVFPSAASSSTLHHSLHSTDTNHWAKMAMTEGTYGADSGALHLMHFSHKTRTSASSVKAVLPILRSFFSHVWRWKAHHTCMVGSCCINISFLAGHISWSCWASCLESSRMCALATNQCFNCASTLCLCATSFQWHCKLS